MSERSEREGRVAKPRAGTCSENGCREVAAQAAIVRTFLPFTKLCIESIQDLPSDKSNRSNLARAQTKSARIVVSLTADAKAYE